jgi:hypothetical protein
MITLVLSPSLQPFCIRAIIRFREGKAPYLLCLGDQRDVFVLLFLGAKTVDRARDL